MILQNKLSYWGGNHTEPFPSVSVPWLLIIDFCLSYIVENVSVIEFLSEFFFLNSIQFYRINANNKINKTHSNIRTELQFQYNIFCFVSKQINGKFRWMNFWTSNRQIFSNSVLTVKPIQHNYYGNKSGKVQNVLSSVISTYIIGN